MQGATNAKWLLLPSGFNQKQTPPLHILKELGNTKFHRNLSVFLKFLQNGRQTDSRYRHVQLPAFLLNAPPQTPPPRQPKDSSLNSVLDGVLSHAQADLPWIVSCSPVFFIHPLPTISKFLERNTRFKMKIVSNIRDGFIGPN
jgi:hypothetical protein